MPLTSQSPLSPAASPSPSRPIVGPGEPSGEPEAKQKAAEEPTPAGRLVDAVRHRSEALAGTSQAARGINAGLKLATGAQRAGQGDAYGASSGLASALDKLSLSNSAIGLAANAAVLTQGNAELREQHRALGKSYRELTDTEAEGTKRAKAALSLAGVTGQLAAVWRALLKSSAVLGRAGLAALSKVSAFKPVVEKANAAFAKLGLTKFGKAFGFLNKWVPLLNVTWLVMSAKTAFDVFKDPKSSVASKALAIGSVGLAGAVLVGGITLGGPAFFGLVGAGLATDLALAHFRGRDQKRSEPAPAQ